MYVAKIADFGYSSIVRGNNGIVMPMSWPWVAPEWNEDKFNPLDAKKMDAYSFGMLCLWLILYMSLNNPEGKLEDLRNKHSGNTYAASTSLIESHGSLQAPQKEMLDKLFSLTLVKDPNCRSFDFNQFLGCLTTDRYYFQKY